MKEEIAETNTEGEKLSKAEWKERKREQKWLRKELKWKQKEAKKWSEAIKQEAME